MFFAERKTMSIFKNIKSYILLIFDKKNIGYTLIALCLWLSLTILLASGYLPDSSITVGKVAIADIRSSKNFERLDTVATEQARLEAANKVKNIMSKDPIETDAALKDVVLTFEKIKELKNKPLTSEEKLEITKTVPLSITPESMKLLLNSDNDFLEFIVAPMTQNIVRTVMASGIEQSTLPKAIQKTKNLVKQQNIPYEYRQAVEEIATNTIRVNMIQDWKAVKTEQEKQMKAVAPRYMTVSKGEIIIRRGEVVTPKQLELLEAMNMHQSRMQIQGIVASAFFSFIIFALLYYDIKTFIPKLLGNKRIFTLIGAIIIATATICKITANSSVNEMAIMYLTPIASASILIHVLSNARVSILSTILLSSMLSIFSHSYSIGIVSLVTGIIAIMSFANITRRSEMMKASLMVVGTNMLMAFIMDTFSPDPSQVWTPILYGGVNGIFSCTIALGGLVFIENLFPVVTNIKLLDIANPSEPLLQRLVNEAPGTHVHSILVGNLAEAGANAIGANALLARVGAYYHDIGKLKRPSLFIENQFGMFNPHEKLTPTLSTLIIVSHVKYGTELAKKYKLPEPVIDIITQHHGTSLITYFHHQAKKKGGEVRAQDFCYPGPKPQTKEAAIVMMADSIEAAVRALQRRNQVGIDALINKIIDDMLKNGQFDECEISFKNIKTLKRVFLKNIASMYHTRIDYPEKLLKDFAPEKKQKNEFKK